VVDGYAAFAGDDVHTASAMSSDASLIHETRSAIERRNALVGRWSLISYECRGPTTANPPPCRSFPGGIPSLATLPAELESQMTAVPGRATQPAVELMVNQIGDTPRGEARASSGGDRGAGCVIRRT